MLVWLSCAVRVAAADDLVRDDVVLGDQGIVEVVLQADAQGVADDVLDVGVDELLRRVGPPRCRCAAGTSSCPTHSRLGSKFRAIRARAHRDDLVGVEVRLDRLLVTIGQGFGDLGNAARTADQDERVDVVERQVVPVLGAGQGDVDLGHRAVEQGPEHRLEVGRGQAVVDLVDLGRRELQEEVLPLSLVAEVDLHLLGLEPEAADQARRCRGSPGRTGLSSSPSTQSTIFWSMSPPPR